MGCPAPLQQSRELQGLLQTQGQPGFSPQGIAKATRMVLIPNGMPATSTAGTSCKEEVRISKKVTGMTDVSAGGMTRTKKKKKNLEDAGTDTVLTLREKVAEQTGDIGMWLLGAAAKMNFLSGMLTTRVTGRAKVKGVTREVMRADKTELKGTRKQAVGMCMIAVITGTGKVAPETQMSGIDVEVYAMVRFVYSKKYEFRSGLW